jgi:MoaA/NifB/PqqE/SkfB family radical SAM enzyme
MKFYAHQDRLAMLRVGQHVAPLHVQLIVSDLCQQNCGFCMAVGTMVSTPSGDRRIEEIKGGDTIYGPDGQATRTRETSVRDVEEVVELVAGGCRIVASPEHPVLTQDGWKEIGRIHTGDSAVVRVRMRETCCSVTRAGVGGLEAGPPMPHSERATCGDSGLRIAGLALERGLELRPVTSVRRIHGPVRVYNVSCDPVEAFEANGIVVHNCAYRQEGYTTNTLFGVEEAGRRNNNPNRQIPTDKVIEILSDCARLGVKAIQFTGGGEPCLHKDLDRFLRYGEACAFDLALVTNGVAVTPAILEPLLAGGDNWVRFSIDAGTAETYCAMRRAPRQHWTQVFNHIGMAVKMRDDTPRARLVIGVGFVVTKENWREVVQATQLAKDLCVDNIRISAVFQSDDADYFKDFHVDAAHACAQAEQLATETFQVINMFGDRLSDLELAHPDYTACGVQRLTTYIGGDQSVYRCCNLAYHPRGFLGSLIDRRFYDLWKDTQTHKDFDAFDAHGCPRCQFNEKNRVMAEAIKPIKNVNFV